MADIKFILRNWEHLEADMQELLRLVGVYPGCKKEAVSSP